MYGFLHKPVVNTGRSTGWGGGWVEGLTALLMQRAIETVLQPLDLIQQMMSPLQTQESLFYQPGNTATTYPGHMTQCLHSPCMDVRSEAHKHTQTMEPLSGPAWLIGPPTWTNMNNLHNLSLQTTTWWNKQDSRAVRWPSRLDLVRWTLAPCSMWTSGTITITTDCASGGTTCGNVCTKNKQYLKKLLFEESFRYYRIMFLLFCFCFLHVMNIIHSHVCCSYRVTDRAARAIGRQLAVIGDQLDHEWGSRRPNWLPTPLHMLRPAQALTRTIYRYKITTKKHLSLQLLCDFLL